MNMETYVLKIESRLDNGKLTYRIVKPSGRRHGPFFESEEEAREYLKSNHVVHDHSPNEWISFEDQLPGEGEAVLLYCTSPEASVVSASPNKMIGYLEEGRFTILDIEYFCDGSISASIEDFSHWCVLPEDPL